MSRGSVGSWSGAENDARARGRLNQTFGHRLLDRGFSEETRAVLWYEVVGTNLLEGLDCFAHYCLRRGGEVPSANDGIDLVDSGDLLNVTDRVDNSGVSA